MKHRVTVLIYLLLLLLSLPSCATRLLPEGGTVRVADDAVAPANGSFLATITTGFADDLKMVEDEPESVFFAVRSIVEPHYSRQSALDDMRNKTAAIGGNYLVIIYIRQEPVAGSYTYVGVGRAYRVK